jgi:hypothetical protein
MRQIGNSNKTLIFIGGMPRSGTTLFRQILLHASKDICVCNTDNILYNYEHKIGNLIRKSTGDANKMANVLQNSTFNKYKLKEAELAAALKDIKPEEKNVYRAVCKRAILSVVNSCQHEIIVFKSPLSELHWLDLYDDLNAHCALKFLYITRNPEGSFKSYKYSPFIWKNKSKKKGSVFSFSYKYDLSFNAFLMVRGYLDGHLDVEHIKYEEIIDPGKSLHMKLERFLSVKLSLPKWKDSLAQNVGGTFQKTEKVDLQADEVAVLQNMLLPYYKFFDYENNISAVFRSARSIRVLRLKSALSRIKIKEMMMEYLPFFIKLKLSNLFK